MWSRRALFLSGGAGLLGACGFQPVYAPDGERNSVAVAGQSPSLTAQLASVRVGPINDRNGQLMRRALQRQLEGLRPGTPARYDLAVTFNFAVEVLGYRRDGTPTRVRQLATANWILSTAAVPPEVVDRGAARTLDSFNIPDLQFFAADSSRDAMERRVIDELSERVVLAVAAGLRRRSGQG
ncbi:LPS assembly lipoprotein LptE [Roseococcus sp. YIM B11640]|uniref:LPS assembly lipoprotein LptE n=1 Tax=Roseococcus sp. YIM B11640 TaxID=3133973 RepID=UPI003C7C9493